MRFVLTLNLFLALLSSSTAASVLSIRGGEKNTVARSDASNQKAQRGTRILSNRRAQATDDGTPKYQRFPYYWPHCPDGFDITTQEECGEAIAYLGVTNGGTPWTGSRSKMPKFCSLQKNTDSTIFNTDPNGDQRRWDLAPVCKWTGEEAPPDFFRVSREDVTEWRGVEHTLTVKPEEWDYFLAFQESRKNGFSCPCNPGLDCNELKATGKHWYPPNPEKVTFDCTLWIAAWLHAEDQCIQGYFNHDSRDGISARMRCEAVGAVYKGEHQAGRHATGLGALTGLQISPGHCNSMFDTSFLGFAAAHGARRNDPRGDGDVWTVLYNGGGSDISDSESCIPAGYTATGEQTLSQPTTPPQSTPSPTSPTPEPTTPTPGPPSDYQKLDYGEVACPEGLEIESENECSKAIAALGITEGDDPWTGSRTTMPKGCSLQKETNTMIFNRGEGGSGRHDLAPVCKFTGAVEPTPTPTPGPPSDYQKFDYGEVACPEGLEIESKSECSEAIAAFGITEGDDPWTGSRTTMPRGCSLQKETNNMVFNKGEGGSGRHDLAPVCKFTGAPEPNAPSPVASPPTPIITCEFVDDNKFLKKKKKKSCSKWVGKKNVNKMQEKCNKTLKKKKIHHWCPFTCGKKAGLGECAFLKK